MGWTESPPCFCAGTETARDLMDIMLPLTDELEVHNFEPKMEPAEGGRPTIPPPPPKKKPEDDDMSMSSDVEETTPIKTIFEVFMDDFMAMTNDIEPKNLTRISRVMLHAIHNIFPPPEVTGHQGDGPI